MNSTESLYSRLGGEAVLREFVSHLYDFMDDLTIMANHLRNKDSVIVAATKPCDNYNYLS